MPGLVPGIHAFPCYERNKTWMAGTSPAMTVECVARRHENSVLLLFAIFL